MVGFIWRRRGALVAIAALTLAACGAGGGGGAPGAPAVVNVYSARHYEADRALFAAFTEATGVEVRAIEGLQGDQLIERLRAEGDQSPADVIFTVDAGNLWRLEREGLLQPAASEALTRAVPERLRHPDGLWHGLAKRARVIAYAKDRIAPEAVASYDSLAAPALKGKVCARSSTNVYNLSLLASRIERAGKADALTWAKGVAGNFARDPQGGDTDQLKAIAAGLCDAAIVNHYYWVRLSVSKDPAEREVAAAIALSFPDQEGAGAHVNISGAGVALHAPNRDNAIRFLEFMTSVEAQAQFAALNDEFPIREDAPLPPQLAPFAGFKEDPMPVEAFGRRQGEAQELFDLAGWR